MAWTISNSLMRDYENSTSSLARVAGYSQANLTETRVFVPSNESPTPKPSLWHDKTMGRFPLSRFGMMCAPLTESHGAELLTWFLAASLVQTSAQPGQTAQLTENKKASTEKIAGSGLSKRESFVKWSPSRYKWKTPQISLFGDLSESCGTWPRWGSMLNGECYQEKPLTPLMSGNGCGLWLPTPTAHNAKEGNYPAERTRNTPTLAAVLGGKINPEFTEWMMGWPIGHTDLKPSGTAKSHWLRQQHGECSGANE